MKIYYLKFKKVLILIIFFIYLMNIIAQIDYGEVCLCTIGKNENRYIREFVAHYKNYGVDKIFLYDNNDFNGENFKDVLSDYIESKYIKIINYRGKKIPQLKFINDCYKKNYHNYNWIIFYDIDEYIYLKDYKNIKNFLNQKKFNKCQRIQLNWIFHTDNNLLHYENKSLVERFPYREKAARGKKIGGIQGIKSIIRGNIKVHINDIHILSPNLKSCDGFGNFKEIFSIATNVSDFYYYYIDHYYCKSTEEFINKILKTDVFHSMNDNIKYLKLKVYFSINEINKEKLDYIENETHLNLSEYRNKIKNK